MIKELILLCLIWGFNFVVMKVANDFFSPELFVTYRFVYGAIVLLAVAFFVKLPKPPRKYWSWIILTGALQIAFCSVAMQICFEYMSAGEVAMLNYTMPIWVTILAKFFLNEPLTAKKILGVTLSIAGIFILMNDDLSGNLFAILLALTAAMGWAVSNILMKIKFVGFNLISLTTWQMVAGAIILSVYCACFVDTTAIWTPLSIACIAYNGILASALAFFLWMYILSRTQASKASVSILGVPVVGVISGVIFLQEPLTVLMSVGIIMILSGIVLVQRS
ncbi:MAG: EamA family transporter [Selenomonadaceae bacterium]|nr:EamA family transporter [Selenomonadaceae bacterium]